jgi:hypothetical protein
MHLVFNWAVVIYFIINAWPQRLNQSGQVNIHHIVNSNIIVKGSRITFGFLECPLCKKPISHPSLVNIMAPILSLKRDVEVKETKNGFINNYMILFIRTNRWRGWRCLNWRKVRILQSQEASFIIILSDML